MIFRLRRAWLLGLVLLLVSAHPAAAQRLEDKVREHDLDNGLKLLVVERHDTPTVTAYITLKVGSVDETSEMRGVAHLLEHMLFKGTTTIGTSDWEKERPIQEAIEKVGARLDDLRGRPNADPQEVAELNRRLDELQAEQQKYVVKDEFSSIYAEHGGVGFNAFTSKDLTSYLISLPSNKLELWAAIEADRLKNAVMREFYTEREVVKEERRRAYETNPGGLLYENILANSFLMHPYRNPIIGWMSDIDNLTLEQTRQFFDAYYAPANMVIALVGDVRFDDAVALVEKYFGDMDPGTPMPPVRAVEPPQRGERRVAVQFDAEPRVAISFHKPTLPHVDDYTFDLINLVLAGGRTSRLYQSLVVDKAVATSVNVYGAPGARYSNLFVISAVPRHPHTPAEVEEAIFAELDRLTREPVPDEELQRARNRLQTDHLRMLRENNGLARMLTYYQTVAGDWRYLVDYDDVIAELTAENVMKTARRYFRPENRTITTVSREEGSVMVQQGVRGGEAPEMEASRSAAGGEQ
jgi:predicted Zn-dependent peptidase